MSVVQTHTITGAGLACVPTGVLSSHLMQATAKNIKDCLQFVLANLKPLKASSHNLW